MKRRSGILAMNGGPLRGPPRRKITCAPYSVATSLPRFTRTPRPFSPDRRRHRAEDPKRREEHDVVRVLEHHFRERFAELHHRARFGADRRAGRAEDEREHHDLQHFAPRHRVDDAGGKGVLENLREAGGWFAASPAAGPLQAALRRPV